MGFAKTSLTSSTVYSDILVEFALVYAFDFPQPPYFFSVLCRGNFYIFYFFEKKKKKINSVRIF